MHLLHKQTMKGTQRYPLAKGIMSVCTNNNKGEREGEHHEWRQLLLRYARQPEGHYLALIAAQPPPFLCVLKREGCAATSARLSQINWANSTRMHGKSSFCCCSYKCS